MLDRIKVRGPMRCHGVGRLECAEEIATGARVAVRWLPLEANAEQARDALRALPSHPALPAVLEVGQDARFIHAIFEFPEGRLLAATLGQELSVEELLRLGAELADGLAALHGQGSCHGELSPHSVLRTAAGRALLWDVPLVVANRITDRRRTRRELSTLPELAPSLAPETARGELPSNEGDIYALATILCFAAGAPLPAAPSALALVHHIATGLWQPKIPERLGRPVRALLARMLAASPELRPSALQAAEALRAAAVPGAADAAAEPEPSAPLALPSLHLESAAPIEQDSAAALEESLERLPTLAMEGGAGGGGAAEVPGPPRSVEELLPTLHVSAERPSDGEGTPARRAHAAPPIVRDTHPQRALSPPRGLGPFIVVAAVGGVLLIAAAVFALRPRPTPIAPLPPPPRGEPAPIAAPEPRRESPPLVEAEPPSPEPSAPEVPTAMVRPTVEKSPLKKKKRLGLERRRPAAAAAPASAPAPAEEPESDLKRPSL